MSSELRGIATEIEVAAVTTSATTKVRGALSLPEKHALVPGVPWRVLAPLAIHAEEVRTRHARRRFRAWIRSGGAQRSTKDLAETMAYYGDQEIWPAVVAAVQTVPEMVRAFLLQQAVVFGIGWRSSGWVNGGFRIGRRQVVVLSGHQHDVEAIRRVMIHEAAHLWLESFGGKRHPATAREALSLTQKIERIGGGREWIECRTQTVEARACALAELWLHSEGAKQHVRKVQSSKRRRAGSRPVEDRTLPTSGRRTARVGRGEQPTRGRGSSKG